jgi:fucose permease
MTSNTLWPLIGTLLTLTAFAISGTAIPPLITSIADDIGVAYTGFVYVVMVQYFSFFLACLLGGWLCERYGVNARSFVLLGLGVLTLVFFVGTQLTTLTGFIVWAILLGLAGGLVEAFGCIIISNYEKPGSAKMLNLSQVFYCLGAMAAPLVIAMMLYRQFSWQNIFFVMGLLIGVITIVFLALTQRDESDGVQQEKTPNGNAKPMYTDALFIYLSIMLFVYVTCESMVASWIAVYFEHKLAISAPNAASRLVLFWAGVVVGRFVVAVLPARYSLWKAVFCGIILMILTALLGSLVLSAAPATLLLFLHGVAIGPLWPTLVAIASAARHRAKFTSGVIAFSAIGVTTGSGLGSILLKVADGRLFFPAITVGGVVLLILAILTRRRYYDS